MSPSSVILPALDDEIGSEIRTDIMYDATEAYDPNDTIPLDEMLEVVLHADRNKAGYIEQFLIIKTKSKLLVRLKLNRTQRRILAKIDELQAQGKPVRLIILKARQEGVSTFVQALYFMYAATTPNLEIWTLAHDVESSRNMLLMANLYLDRLPDEITPMVSGRDKKRIVFSNPDVALRKDPRTAGLLSRIYIDQAKNANAGRSTTISHLHISEEAFWGDSGGRTKLSLMQSVPHLPNTMVIRESTAFGVGDAAEFHEDWVANYMNPRSEWTCLFFGAHEHEEYSLPVPDEFKGDDGKLILIPDPDGEMREPDLRDGSVARCYDDGSPYPLSDEQIYWRRVIMASKCKSDPIRFMQEYPYTPEQAFQTSGRPWFSRIGMEFLAKGICDPVRVGTFRHPRPLGQRDTVDKIWRDDMYDPAYARRGHMPKFVTEDTGDWWLWKLPTPGYEYWVSVDTAEGGTDGDKAAIEVFCRNTLEQVAEFSGYLDPDLLAHQAAMVCRFYNDATAIPEVNNTGYAFMSTFRRLWHRIYFREDPDAPVGGRTTTWQYGFKTNVATRPIICARGQAYVREAPTNGFPVIRSSRLFNEMLSFQKDKNGTPRAIGSHAMDDLVMAWLIGLEEQDRRPVRVTKVDAAPTLLDDKDFQAHQQRRGKSNRRSPAAKTF